MALLLLYDVGNGDNNGSTARNGMIGLRSKRNRTELLGRSNKRGLEQSGFIIGSGGGGVEREGLGELGGGEGHCYLCFSRLKEVFGNPEKEMGNSPYRRREKWERNERESN